MRVLIALLFFCSTLSAQTGWVGKKMSAYPALTSTPAEVDYALFNHSGVTYRVNVGQLATAVQSGSFDSIPVLQLAYVLGLDSLLRPVRDTSCGKPWCTGGNAPTNSTSFIGTTNSKDLVFKTKNTEAMRIDTNGNVGIGVSSGIYEKFRVDGFFKNINYQSGVLHGIYNTDDFGPTAILIQDTTTGQKTSYEFDQQGWNFLSIDSLSDPNQRIFNTNGSTMTIQNYLVGIGTATPTAKLHVNGTTRLEGTPQSTTSDSLLTIDGQGNVAWRTPYYYGTDTLTNGVDTVWTSDVTANSIIQLTSNGLNGSTQSGHLDVTIISAGNYFVVNSLKSNTTIETGDQRKYYWFFIRKP